MTSENVYDMIKKGYKLNSIKSIEEKFAREFPEVQYRREQKRRL